MIDDYIEVPTEAAMANEAGQHPEAAPEPDTPYIKVMKTWARWMTLSDRQHSDGLSHPQDVKEFMACGEAVDVMIGDLPIYERWAIRKAHGLATAWIYPERSLAATLLSAEQILSAKMVKNVATRRYFN